MRPAATISLALTILLSRPSAVQAADATPVDQIRVQIEPTTHWIGGVIDVDLAGAKSNKLRFLLHGGLEVSTVDDGVRVEVRDKTPDVHRYGINEDGDGGVGVPLYEYEVRGDVADGRLRLAVSGVIDHPLTSEGEEYARSFARTPGMISLDGILLSGSTFWLPRLAERSLAGFRLEVDLPAGWDAVSQGTRLEHEEVDGRRRVVWSSEEPMEEVYVVAAPFVTYERTAGAVTAQVFLRQPDPNLATKYLDATAQYLEMYDAMLGAYPYRKFALVENFWETGYGMPSFTLLGPKIIRFPFILTSSYPHEILHNWWGNGVFVDYDSGNWCEGLTAYLADHLLKEGQGQGWTYRRDTLKRYSDHVRGGRDFPLREFRSRHSSATEAVGYGKSLMLWHMLRLRLGDDLFVAGLRRVYETRRFQATSFADIEAVFTSVAGEDLQPFFAQWVARKGAPELRLKAQWKDKLQLELRQVQGGGAYEIDVPVAIALEDGAIRRELVHMVKSTAKLELELAARPVEVVVDPTYDVFRRLHRDEIAPTMSELFGADRVALILPTEDRAMPVEAWRVLADSWREGGDDVVVVDDDELSGIPGDRPVWLLGSDNRWASDLTPSLTALGARLSGDRYELGAGVEAVASRDHSFAVALRHPENPDVTVGWIGADGAAAIPGLARKLPHYGKYSYLVFEGDEPSNVRKGQWPAVASPLVHRFEGVDGGVSVTVVREDREPLAKPTPAFDGDALLSHVKYLASSELEGRGLGSDGIDLAADYIAAAFERAGLEPGGDAGGYFQTWREDGGPDGRGVTLKNVVGVLRGRRADWSAQSVVLGAHYDHLGRGWPDVRSGHDGEIHPGADDNASGVAVLLEVARLLGAQLEPERTIVFAAFSGEEWGLKGSRRYVQSATPWPARDALAMVNLDTVGRLAGDKLVVLGAGSATEWVHIARGIGFTTGVESKAIMDDLGASDQKSFLDAGVPAVQLFTGAHDHYHRPSDTIEVVEGETLVKVATFTREAVVYLSERDRPMTSTLAPSPAATAPAADAESTVKPSTAPAGSGMRRVTLGTLPDFGFQGPGVRVERVLDGSPAERAGLKAGDLILAIDGESVADLRGFAGILRKYEPGARVAIRVERDEETIALEAELAER